MVAKEDFCEPCLRRFGGSPGGRQGSVRRDKHIGRVVEEILTNALIIPLLNEVR